MTLTYEVRDLTADEITAVSGAGMPSCHPQPTPTPTPTPLGNTITVTQSNTASSTATAVGGTAGASNDQANGSIILNQSPVKVKVTVH